PLVLQVGEWKAPNQRSLAMAGGVTVRRKWGLLGMLIAITGVAVAASVMISRPRAATALQGTICGQYSLPQGAEVSELGVTRDANKKLIIAILYKTPDGGSGQLTIPFDTIAATCSDPKIRGIVAAAQEEDTKATQSSCKFVEDLMAGRVQLPPDVRDTYDRAYAEQWYRKMCRGTK